MWEEMRLGWDIGLGLALRLGLCFSMGNRFTVRV